MIAIIIAKMNNTYIRKKICKILRSSLSLRDMCYFEKEWEAIRCTWPLTYIDKCFDSGHVTLWPEVLKNNSLSEWKYWMDSNWFEQIDFQLGIDRYYWFTRLFRHHCPRIYMFSSQSWNSMNLSPTGYYTSTLFDRLLSLWLRFL